MADKIEVTERREGSEWDYSWKCPTDACKRPQDQTWQRRQNTLECAKCNTQIVRTQDGWILPD